ncbi:MAG: hypothetical protein IPJ37_02940 [Bacteroidales bacterium]|nr:hypothetical protein [Bacteroidales bacterium]
MLPDAIAGFPELITITGSKQLFAIRAVIVPVGVPGRKRQNRIYSDINSVS